MVLGTCRGRVIRNADDAEDAFQATFLVLVCKAGGGSGGKRDALGGWLHQVAHRDRHPGWCRCGPQAAA